jgi:hypothetical protein
MAIYGGRDEQVPVSGPETWMAGIDESGGAYRYAMYPTRGHETSFPGSSEARVLEWLEGLPAREHSPVHVSYTVVRDMFQPTFGLSYDGAYWVDDLRLSTGAGEGSIDATRASAEQLGVVIGPSAGVDGTSPLRMDRLDDVAPYRIQGRDASVAHEESNFVRLTLRGLSAASLDIPRMGWDLTRAMRVEGATDTPIRITLSGVFPAVLAIDGASFVRHGSDVVLDLPSGSFSVTITPG